MADILFDNGVKNLVSGVNWTSATLKIALVGTSFAGTKATAVYVSDVTLDEFSGSGYTGGHGGAGRKTLANASVSIASNVIKLDADDPAAWSSLSGDTVGGALIFVEGPTNDTDAILLCFLDLTDTVANGGDISVSFHADGIINIDNS